MPKTHLEHVLLLLKVLQPRRHDRWGPSAELLTVFDVRRRLLHGHFFRGTLARNMRV